jgi:hypothetical protein
MVHMLMFGGSFFGLIIIFVVALIKYRLQAKKQKNRRRIPSGSCADASQGSES